MALIKLGALAQDVRGSLNGTTFSRNKGGAYVRSKVSPVQPVSAFSDNSRQAFKIVSQTWAAMLTDANRADWIAFALLHPFLNVFGDSINLSGVAFYQAAMKRLQQIGLPIFDTPPATWAVDPPGAIAPTFAVDTGIPAASLLINPTNPPSGGAISAYLFATKAIAPGAQPQKNDYRLINDFGGNIRDDTYDWGAAYLARFAPYVPPADSKIALLYAYLDTANGALSVPSAATIFTTASPGPFIAVGIKEKVDAGGGLVNGYLTTNTPHGLTTGDPIDVALSPADAYYDGSGRTDYTVLSPTVIVFSATLGVAGAPTTTAGTLQKQ